MNTGKPVFEKSRSVQDMQHMRLMALLNELVRDKGVMKATQLLGVDYKTLTASMERGRLSRRMRSVLEKALLEGEGSPAAEQRERNDSLDGRLTEVEGRVDALGRDMSKGLSAVRGDVKAIGDEQAQMGRRLAQLESGRAARDGAAPGAGAQSKRGSPVRREFPDLVTIEPADDDADVFGNAWPLIVEWREIEGRAPQRRQGPRLADRPCASAGGGAGAARRPRHDAAPGDVPAAGLRAGRADQLAKDRALRHAESAEEA